jgi:excisionase family DNA binding protein
VSETVRLYPVAKAAEVLGIGRTFMYSLINSGQIRVVELGTSKAKQRVRADDLQAFIDSRTYGANPKSFFSSPEKEKPASRANSDIGHSLTPVEAAHN